VVTSSIRWSTFIPGLLCLIVGTVWALQGVGLLPGSFMSGRRLWLGVGVLVDIIGLFLVYRGLSRRAASGTRSGNWRSQP
jgi:hypothetical protein